MDLLYVNVDTEALKISTTISTTWSCIVRGHTVVIVRENNGLTVHCYELRSLVLM